jgi:hypothetical protein
VADKVSSRVQAARTDGFADRQYREAGRHLVDRGGGRGDKGCRWMADSTTTTRTSLCSFAFLAPGCFKAGTEHSGEASRRIASHRIVDVEKSSVLEEARLAEAEAKVEAELPVATSGGKGIRLGSPGRWLGQVRPITLVRRKIGRDQVNGLGSGSE